MPKHFAISSDRILREKETKDCGWEKANARLSNVASALDRWVMREEGQDALRRADCWLVRRKRALSPQNNSGLSHSPWARFRRFPVGLINH